MFERYKVILFPLLSAFVALVAVSMNCKNQPEDKSPTTKMNRAVELRAQGKHQEAIGLIEEMVREAARTFGFRSWQHVEALHWLAKGRADMWQFQQADSAYFLAETILSEYFDADSALAELYLEHGIVKSVQKDIGLSGELFEKSYELFSRALGPCGSNTLKAVDALAHWEVQRGKPEAAIPYLERSMKCRVTAPEGVDLTTFRRAQELLLYYSIAKKIPEAKQFANELLAQDDSIKYKFYSAYSRIYLYVSDLYRHENQFELAQSCLQQGMILSLRNDDSLSNTFVWSVRSYGDILCELLDSSRAEQYFERAYRLTKLAFGPASDEFRKSGADLVLFFRARGQVTRAQEIERQLSR